MMNPGADPVTGGFRSRRLFEPIIIQRTAGFGQENARHGDSSAAM
jgi:hypothetical protein